MESRCACIASLPATPLSHVPIGPKTGGFASPPYDGFALTLRSQLTRNATERQRVRSSMHVFKQRQSGVAGEPAQPTGRRYRCRDVGQQESADRVDTPRARSRVRRGEREPANPISDRGARRGESPDQRRQSIPAGQQEMKAWTGGGVHRQTSNLMLTVATMLMFSVIFDLPRFRHRGRSDRLRGTASVSPGARATAPPLRPSVPALILRQALGTSARDFPVEDQVRGSGAPHRLHRIPPRRALSHRAS